MQIKFKRDTSFRKQFFVPDSFAHPAKMDAQLLIWIVEHYTRYGETIIDPMAGSGTTMLACTLDRNCILVELEEKFCKMCRDNWEQVKMRPQLGYSVGDCQIIQGDARQLEGLVDKIVTSPPFQAQKAGGSQGAGKYSGIDLSQGINRVKDDYAQPKHPNSIDSLPYGEIDKCIFSPPYSTAGAKGDENPENYIRREEERLKKFPNRPKTFVGRYSGDWDNIGNLPYGQIDKIVTSPPYEGQKTGEIDADRWATYMEKRDIELDRNWGKDRHTEGRMRGIKSMGSGYSESQANIGNLKSQSYLEAMLQVYQQCYKVLKSQGLMILVTKNFIRNKQVVRLDEDTIKLCEQAGFSFVERHYRKLPSQSFWRVIYHQKHPEVEQILNEDVLVFRKQ